MTDAEEPDLPARPRADDGAHQDLQRELDVERARSRRLQRQVSRLRDEKEELRSKLDDVYASETFRLGRALLRFPRWLEARVRRRSAPGRGPGSRRVSSPRGFAAVTRRGPVAEFDVEAEGEIRRDYLDLARKGSPRGDSDRIAVAFGVSTIDLDAGRGDLFAAIGLGRYLERHGFDVAMVPPSRWDEVPPGTDVFVAMIAEPEIQVDPLLLPEGCALVGWIRNSTERWASLPALPLYDAILCSSTRSADLLRRTFSGPVGVLPLAVDHELFHGGGDDRSGMVATVNQWTHEKPRDIYRLLAQVDLDVPLAIYGIQRGLYEELQPYQRGQLSFFELPSLYRKAGYVLDDQQPVNRRFGNVNSRVYEALACGALPVTAAPAGLPEVGLDGVPTVTNPGEIRDAVHGREADRASLVEELTRRVREHHTFERRAGEFSSFLQERQVVARDGAPNNGRGKLTVLGFQPDYRATNPYQTMLYSQLEGSSDIAVLPVDDVGSFVGSVRRRNAMPAVHVHWTAPILGPAGTEREARSRLDEYLDGLEELERRSGRLIWTVHNSMPHECSFPDIERALRQELAQRADVIHVMCPSTPEIVAEYGYTLPEARVHVIPHGSYVDVYPNLVASNDARAELGLEQDAFVYLFLGQIRPYKGLDRLLDAFEVVRRTEPASQLVVAGAPGRFRGVGELTERMERQPQVHVHAYEIPDVDIQLFLNACDVFVLPHERVLNSGGIQLAFSFGRPVVAPATGCVPNAVPPGLGVLFGAEEPLHEALLEAREHAGDETRRRAYEHALSYTFLDMSRDLRSLLDHP